MSVTCPSCGQRTKSRDFCEFCNMPLGLQGHIAAPEVLPRLQVPKPATPPEDLADIPVALPAPPRTAPPQPLRLVGQEPPRRVEPLKSAGNGARWLVAIGGVIVLLLAAVALAEVVARVRGGSLVSAWGPAEGVKTIGPNERQPSADQLAREKGRAAGVSDATLAKMLELAKPKNNEVVIDLGCADGRLALQVAEKYGLGVFAWDNDPALVKLARRLAAENFRDKLIDIQHTDDVLGVDLGKGDIIFLVKPERFGSVQEVSQRMEKKWFDLKDGVRIVSTQPVASPHRPLVVLPFHPPEDPGRPVTIYLYETPLD
jgi:SAM-dependent methyltransferase